MGGEQVGQIGLIFAHRVIVYFGQVFGKKQKKPIFLGYFFRS
jgi:hypothetical protein